MFLNLGELCVNCIIVLPDMKCHVCVRGHSLTCRLVYFAELDIQWNLFFSV